MTSAAKNLIVFDSRLSKIGSIEMADELKVRLGINNMSFVLNRAGYAPSLFLKLGHLLNKIRNVKQG
jgi:hypothetical protein